MKIFRFLTALFAASFLCFAGDFVSAEKANKSDTFLIEEEIGGTLINQTKTNIGQKFFRALSEAHLSNPKIKHLNFVVHERSSARWGSLIWINNGQKEVYRQFLSPAQRDFKAVAEYAYLTMGQYTEQFELQQLLGDHFDIDKDEI
ncbi:CsgE family curli-type amyloid fiber assembly protein [uncultured Pseudoteredinibacter sp.]|uniref:CsgE family curli-type amyloid fiber assembly protein n=1 Tax=uncultured Pseudoteredinibacter sp. TaxID=1641701 RepID=UPI00260AA449|nr:CsgE family curli-type amyloid fiber assembly protein [uncultured Pseudoteredinibacter sp.]